MPKEWGGVILSPKCENSCYFCSPPKKIDKVRLREQEQNVAKNLLDFRKHGIRKVEISGSDPIEYDKLVNLVQFMRKIGFDEIQLSTHGRKFCDKSFLKSINHAGLTRVRMPLYGSNDKVHDQIIGSKGSFKDTVEGIKNILKTKIHLQVSCLIMQKNKDDLINLIILLKSLGVYDFYFSIPCLSTEDSSYYIPIKQLPDYIKKTYDFSKKIGFNPNFMEIPFCVLGKYDSCINNRVSPPDLGKNCQPPKQFKSGIKDMPNYRVKTKTKICLNCNCYNLCDGFFEKDINKFGTGGLKPI
jgi:MoaA/NifB/PqqE/SkfB family radical SAM enzyme